MKERPGPIGLAAAGRKYTGIKEDRITPESVKWQKQLHPQANVPHWDAPAAPQICLAWAPTLLRASTIAGVRASPIPEPGSSGRMGIQMLLLCTVLRACPLEWPLALISFIKQCDHSSVVPATLNPSCISIIDTSPPWDTERVKWQDMGSKIWVHTGASNVKSYFQMWHGVRYVSDCQLTGKKTV